MERALADSDARVAVRVDSVEVAPRMEEPEPEEVELAAGPAVLLRTLAAVEDCSAVLVVLPP